MGIIIWGLICFSGGIFIGSQFLPKITWKDGEVKLNWKTPSK